MPMLTLMTFARAEIPVSVRVAPAEQGRPGMPVVPSAPPTRVPPGPLAFTGLAGAGALVALAVMLVCLGAVAARWARPMTRKVS